MAAFTLATTSSNGLEVVRLKRSTSTFLSISKLFSGLAQCTKHGLKRITVQPDLTTIHHNRTEQLLRLMAPGEKCLVTLRCCRGGLNGFRCGANHVDDTFRLGEHRDVAAVELIGGCPHALGEKTLQIRMYGMVFFADDIPAWLRLPCGSPYFRLE